MGAAGLTCSTTEMGSRGGAGVEIDVSLGAAARDRHDAVRDHALRIAGAHAARRQAAAAKPRSSGSSRNGTCTPSRIGEVTERRHAARQGARRRRRRDSEPRADRRGAGVSPADERAGVSREAQQLDLDCASRSRRPIRALAIAFTARFSASPTIASKRWIYRRVRPHGPHQHHQPARARARASCASRGTDRALAMSVDGNGRYCYLDPYRGAHARGGRGGAQRRLLGRASARPRPTA